MVIIIVFMMIIYYKICRYSLMEQNESIIFRRNQARKGNYNLNKTAVNSGVRDLARFHNAGYKGLYNGETANDIAKRKKTQIQGRYIR